LVHTDSCSEALIVDNQDSGFSFLEGADGVAQETVAGYDGDYYYSVPYSTSTDYRRATWTPDIPATGLYALDVWIPAGGAVASESARFDLAYWGGHEVATINQSTGLGDWKELFPGQTFKLLEGTYGNVSLSNATGGEPGDYVAWDALRWRSSGPEGSSGVGGQCTSSAGCLGALVCVSGVCAPPCDAGNCLGGVCDPATGVCVDGDDDDSGDDDDDSSWGDDDDSGEEDDDDSAPTAGEDDENWAYGCECNSGSGPLGRGGRYALGVMLALVLARRRSPAATIRKPNTSHEGVEPAGLPATEA
jgi:hypothetical protein